MGKLNGFKTAVGKSSPKILLVLGVAGMIFSTVLAVKETPKAIENIKEKEEEKGEELTKTEVVKETWKCYIPAAVTMTVATVCIVGSHSIMNKRIVAVATAYGLSDTAFQLYRKNAIDILGEKKETEIADKAVGDRMKDISEEDIFLTGKGETICFDVISGRYFKSNIEDIRRAVNDLNQRMIGGENYISLNELYYALGLSELRYIGDQLGWHVSNELIDIRFSSQLTDNGVPCVVLDYIAPPKYDYDSSF